MSFSKCVVLLLVPVLLVACQPFNEPDSMMDEYIDRLSRVFDEPEVRSDVSTVEALPRRRDRRLDLPEIDMGVTDFLSLYGCDLQVVVGERTSSLGRVMHVGTRLDYEVRFLSAARECLPEIENEQRKKDVESAADQKEESLPKTAWNATWGSEEMEKLWSRSQGTMSREIPWADARDLTGTVQDVADMVGELDPTTRPDEIRPLHDIYQKWQSEAIMGKLLRSAELLTTRMNDASELIENRLDREPVCRDGNPTETAEIADNVFYSVFIEEVQKYLQDIQRLRFQLLPPFQELLDHQADVIPESMAPFIARNIEEDDGSVWKALDDATDRHNDVWQRLFEDCGMEPDPGSDPGDEGPSV